MNFIFNPINKWLDGKKTLIAGIMAILHGLLEITQSLADGVDASDGNVLLAQLTIVFGVFGLGHKIEKAMAFLKK